MTFSAIHLIETKRDGGKLSSDAIEWLIEAYTDGDIADYQMSAMAMAILFNGLDQDELAVWTAAMLNSGEVMDFSDIAAAKVDKHSTGGVGDKISIPVAPLVATCGVVVPMMSGRGLGHTGGTLDKLESIPGFTTRMNPVEFRRIVEEHGIVMAGQSVAMAPADYKLYSLRDASGTVPSIPLIASSIMSKKLSEGLDGLLLDVKEGSGALMRTLDEGRELAETMVGIGTSYGVKTVALITSNDQPLGNEVGNANEIKESVEVLRGEGPEDVTELTMAFGEVMLELAGIKGGRDLLQSKIDSGEALEKFKDMVEAQQGDVAVVENTDLLVRAPEHGVIVAESPGYVTRCDARTIGIVATSLGAGRERKEDMIDPGVAITIEAKVGDRVHVGDTLATVRYSDQLRWTAQRENLASAWTIGDEAPAKNSLIIERIEAD